MKSLLFVKAHSRLGLYDIPHRGSEQNIGVEDGPDAVLSDDFLTKYSPHQLITYTFPTPETVEKSQYISIVALQSKNLAERIITSSSPTTTIVVAGGDHSISLASLKAVSTNHDPKNIGLILFDSHGDINTIASSPTGNFHGMWLRPFLGEFDNKEVDDLVLTKIPTENVLYVGNLDLDPEELRFITGHKIKVITRKILVEHTKDATEGIKTFLSAHKHIHISFDIDVFDMSIAPATGTPRSGLFTKNVFPLLSLIATHPSLSIDLVEINPKKEGARQTISLAQQVLAILLS